MNIYFGICCKHLGIDYVNNVSGLGTAFLHDGVAYRVARALYGYVNKRAKTVFFQNQEDSEEFIRRGIVDSTRCELLPGSGVNIEKFAFKAQASSDELHFLMVSRLIKDKGVVEFIEAAALVKQQRPNCQFTLVGGPAANKTALSEQELTDYKAQGAVNFVGHSDQVLDYFYQANVFVLPSYREGMPKTVLEAASCGRPAIVSDVPGCRQAIINEQTGWLVEVKSSQALANKMLALAEADRSVIANAACAARDNVEKNFSEQIVIDKYLNCLN